jgi:Cys-tRNA(Pro) deacylase
MKRDMESVRAFLESHGVQFELRRFDHSTHTAGESAAQLGIPVAQVIKTLCFVADDKPILVLCPGPNRVSMKKLKALTGCKKLPTARPEQIEAWTGFAVGGVNPFFEDESVPIYCDPLVLQQERVWFGAGGSNALVSVAAAELSRVLKLHVVDVKEEGSV